MGQTEGLPEKLTAEQEAWFPNLAQTGYQVASERTLRYNCVAYAAGDEARKWDPGMVLVPGYYWPEGAARGTGIEALESAFATLGYKVCASGDLEAGYEKIALYADKDGQWLHAAKQLPGGKWSSKLGNWEDIVHPTPYALCGPSYGSVWHSMKRPVGGGSA